MDDLLKNIDKYSLQVKNVQIALRNIAKLEPDPNKRLIVLEKEIKKIEKFLSEHQTYEEIPASLSTFLEEVTKEKDMIDRSIKMQFGSQLNTLLQEKGFKLEGNYPVYHASLFTIKVDFLLKKVEIFFGPEFESLAKCKTIPDDVAKALIEEYEKITQRSLNDEGYLDQLLEAYRIALLQLKLPFGNEIPISELNSALTFILQPKKYRQNPKKATYTEYDRVLLSFDLSRLKSRRTENYELKLISATRAQTRNRYDFIWIPNGTSSMEGEVISGVKFIEVV
jgi:hypothetical protein